MARLTCDGGVRLVNPSPHGGMWAWQADDRDGRPVARASGVVLPRELNFPTVTNNLTESLALIIGLEWLPAQWSGEVATDSQVATNFLRGGEPKDWIPDFLYRRSQAALRRLGRLTWILLAGHPSKKQVKLMELGIEQYKAKNGLPYSLANHWCDQAATQAWWDYESELERLRNG